MSCTMNMYDCYLDSRCYYSRFDSLYNETLVTQIGYSVWICANALV